MANVELLSLTIGVSASGTGTLLVKASACSQSAGLAGVVTRSGAYEELITRP